jgi:hypothetical protein
VELADRAPAKPSCIAERYPSLQAEVIDVLSQATRCSSRDEQSWLLTLQAFQASPLQGFRWNLYEMMAHDAATTDGERDTITRFWDEHFPFLLSVRADYDYLAVRLSDGCVVHACAPEWELPSVLEPSFGAFVERVIGAVASGELQYPLSVLL